MMGGRRAGLRPRSTSTNAINILFNIEQGRVVDIFSVQTTNPRVTRKSGNPLKEIQNSIPRNPDDPLKGIHNLVPNRARSQWPRVLTIPT